jgi:hypothetical protein
MTATLDAADVVAAPGANPDPSALSPQSSPPPTTQTDDEPLVSPLLTSISAFLSAAAAGWLAGGVFAGFAPRLAGLLGALIGAGAVALSYRTRRPTFVQYAGVAVAAVTGALLVVPDAGKGSANLPSLVLEALREGGIGAPPVPFLPGWRFILVVFIALLAGGSAAVAIGLNKPKIAAFAPLPVIFGAALLQPSSAPAAYTAVAVALVPAALTVSHGARLVQEGSTSSRFEMRRLARSALVVVLMMVLLVVLSALGLFIPKPSDNTVIPPQRPQPPPSQPDRPLFDFTSPIEVPWRLGVLDGYDGKGWLLPPFDPKRLLKIPSTGVVPAAAQAAAAKPGQQTFQVTFKIDDIQGAVAPDVAGPTVVQHNGFSLTIDPRTQALRSPTGRVPSGTTYTVTAALPPSATALISAGPPQASMNEFLTVPAPPADVQTLLDKAPKTNLFDRLSFVRDALYRNVVAAGGGKPVDVPPDRVVAMLHGGDASPFEITAAEVLLARWAGVPARIGYGYFGGEKIGDPKQQRYEVRPKNGATWLEAWFKGYGWVPLVGVPNKAKASLHQNQQDRPDVHPASQEPLTLYVPVRTSSAKLLFELVRYWLARAAGLLLLLGALLWSYPGVLKMLRRSRRERWARRQGPLAEILVAYSELRDHANDLNIGNPYDSPIEFVELIEPDAEHAELAWLVTRTLWGDLHRGVVTDDARLAREMGRSVEKRLAQAQPAISRLLAFGSRVSLRTPYTTEIPNLSPPWISERRHRLKLPRLSWRQLIVVVNPVNWAKGLARLPGALVSVPAATRRMVARLRRRWVPVAATCTAVLVATVTALVSVGPETASAIAQAQPTLPARIAPATFGDYVFKQEPKLEATFQKAGASSLVNPGVFYSIHQGDEIVGSVELAPFKAKYLRTDADLDDVRAGVVQNLITSDWSPTRAGTDVVLTQRGLRTDYYLWFAPDTSYFELLVAGRDLQSPDLVFAALLAYQRGQNPATAGANTIHEIDPRRGGVG